MKYKKGDLVKYSDSDTAEFGPPRGLGIVLESVGFPNRREVYRVFFFKDCIACRVNVIFLEPQNKKET